MLAGACPPPAACPDQVFGVDAPPAEGRRDRAPPPSPISVDPLGCTMVPLLTVCLLTGLAVWTISKSVQYHEVFTVNRRIRYGMYALNAVAVFTGVVVICVHQHKTLGRARG